MSDLERAQWAICGEPETWIPMILMHLAAARREGAEAERAKHEGASEIIQRAAELIKTGTEYQRGAEEMRERAARCARYWAASQKVADHIRALPLTPEDPPRAP